VARDFPRAAAFYRKACDLHYGMGCQYLGDSYLHGEGVARDEARARTLYAQSATLLDDECVRGIAFSCYVLGRMYRDGKGVTVDSQRASGLFHQACRGGNKDACAALRASS
jgi:TPR repeat protein